MPSQPGTEPSQTALGAARIWAFLAFLNYFLYSVDRPCELTMGGGNGQLTMDN
jgi:hypothetical protein